MLILSRYTDEAIVIDGGRIRIVVKEIRGSRVYLGFEAPASIVIDREEVHLARLDEEGKL